MWNLIKYLPLDWRVRNNYCVPKGPSFKRARTVTIPIAGSLLRFKAPRHSPRDRRIPQTCLRPGQDALADGKLSRNHGEGVMANDCWGFRVPFRRQWVFWGPWMTGAKAQLWMAVTVMGRHKEYAFPNTSFFNPRAFEMVLMQYLNDTYGHRHWEGSYSHIPQYHGPVDWHVHNDKLPVPSASFTVFTLQHDGKTRTDPFYLFVFPVTDQHFVEVAFHPYFSWSKSDYDASPISELQEAIFNSITLELSPEAQAGYDKVKAECPDMRLTSNFPPLKWPTPTAAPEASEDRLADRSSANGLPCHRGT